MKPTRKPYQDCSSSGFTIASSWGGNKKSKKKSVESQTPEELYQFKEYGTQSGLRTEIVNDQVIEKNKGLTLLEHYCKMHKKKTEAYWKSAIQDGFVTVEDEVMTDPEIRVDTQFWLEYAQQKVHMGTQTTSTTTESLSEESKSESLADKAPGLDRFLRRVAPMVSDELQKNASNKSVIDFSSLSSVAEDGQDSIVYWKTLSVDLDLRGVVYRDWTGTNFYPAHVAKCTVTRNKERIYDIEYKDGSFQHGVKEEYIHVLGDLSAVKGYKSAHTAAQLKEGMRVHAKVTLKNGVVKYMPGMITKYSSSRNNRSGGLFEVQCEGRSKPEVDLSSDDLLVGLSAGLSIEARMPRKVSLQCTGISWNATGNILAASYGKTDVDGWCDFPGAVCCWAVFGPALVPDNPDFVLDHPSCLMCVSYHPVIPSIVAAGSYNGEIVVWDLTNPEQPLAVSAITEYSHKSPVLSINWVCSSVTSTGGASSNSGDLDSWLVSSVCTGGRALFWSVKNKLAHPVKGAMLPRSKAKSLPSATAAAFATSGTSSSSSSSAPKWMVTGLQGGGILRSQFHRMLAGPTLTQESFKTYPPAEEVFLQLRADDTFPYQSNDGAITSVQCSPFHRNLFLLSGTDGAVKLFHLLEKVPVRVWEPTPPPGSAGVTGTFSPISAASFSPNRPMVFACASSDGFLYIYDLQHSPLSPVAVLECPLQPPVAAEDTNQNTSNTSPRKKAAAKRTGGDAAHNRVTITGLSFNPKQRGLVAVCDYLGRVHIWKLSWKLSNIRSDELSGLNGVANIHASEETKSVNA